MTSELLNPNNDESRITPVEALYGLFCIEVWLYITYGISVRSRGSEGHYRRLQKRISEYTSKIFGFGIKSFHFFPLNDEFIGNGID